MYIGIATNLKTASQFFTTVCKTRSQARMEAMKISDYRGRRENFKISSHTLAIFKGMQDEQV